jgi:hypothetical protein
MYKLSEKCLYVSKSTYKELRTDSLCTNKLERERETIKYSWRIFQNLITRCSSVSYLTHNITCRKCTGLWIARIITWIYGEWKGTDKENTAAYFKVITHGIFWLTYLLTYSLTYPWSWVLLEKLTGFQLVKKFPEFYGTWKFITAFTSARHLSLSWASLIQSIPAHLTSWRSILILSYHLRLGLPCGLFPSGISTTTLYTPLTSPHTHYKPHPSHSSRFYHPK